MSLLAARDLQLAYGPRVVLDRATLAIGPHDRIGLVGANGTGKSSLMRILAGELHADSGEIVARRGTRAGYLPQDVASLPALPLVDAVLSSVPGRAALDARLAQTEADLAAAREPADQLELSQALAELHEEVDHFEERFGRRRAERILSGLGFRPDDLDRPAKTFSGGWKMRAALAGLLLQDPDLLLLDEPTNHLDVPTLEWFDAFLRASRKALVLVSHDREFLNRQNRPRPRARAGGAPVLRGRLGRLQAPARGGRGAARVGRKAAGREAGPARGVHRALRREEHEGDAGQVEGEAARADGGGEAPRAARDPPLPLPRGAALREGGPQDRGAPQGLRSEGRLRRARRPGAARRADRRHRAERRREVDPPQARGGRARAGRRDGEARALRRGGLLRPAPLRAAGARRRRGLDAHLRDARSRSDGARHALGPRPGPGRGLRPRRRRLVPLLRGRRRQEGGRPLRRRARPRRAREAPPRPREPAPARRADEPPRPRLLRGAHRGAEGLRRDAPLRLPQPELREPARDGDLGGEGRRGPAVPGEPRRLVVPPEVARGGGRLER